MWQLNWYRYIKNNKQRSQLYWANTLKIKRTQTYLCKVAGQKHTHLFNCDKNKSKKLGSNYLSRNFRISLKVSCWTNQSKISWNYINNYLMVCKSWGSGGIFFFRLVPILEEEGRFDSGSSKGVGADWINFTPNSYLGV